MTPTDVPAMKMSRNPLPSPSATRHPHRRRRPARAKLFAPMAALLGSVSAFAGVVPAPSPMYAGAEQTDARLLYVGQGASGGRLAIDNHAEFMVTRDDSMVVKNWNNCGTFKWSFGRYGFDGPASEYPLFVADLGGSPALTFDGGDKLRMITEGNTLLPAAIADGVLSVELWVRNPSVEAGEVLVRFEGTPNKDLTAAQFGMAGSTAWQHLVAVSSGGQITFYKDNVQVGAPQAGALSFATSAIINLGAKSFTGSIAAVRIHTEAMTPADIAHNFTGGVMLGTYLFYNINANALDDMVQGDPTRHPTDRETRESKHFRSIWTPSANPNPADNIAARVESIQMPQGETAYDWMAHKLAFHMPIVSDNEPLRGDGRKYKIHHGNKWTGGDFMGYAGDTGFGWGFTYTGWFNDHELQHGVDAHQMGSITGHWWESHANYGPSYGGNPHVNPVDVCPQHSHVYPSTGGNYYHAYLIWDHLEEVPEYGTFYSTRLWSSVPGGSVYPPKGMRDMDLNPATPFDDEWVRMAARNVTWDYPRHPEYKTRYNSLQYNERTHLILLQKVPCLPDGWYEPPKWRAPQQHGYNMCPLVVTPGTVTADLTGFIDPVHGSDWRAMFVAVQSNGTPRYGNIFTKAAQGSFQVLAGDLELYLVVSATPTTIMDIGIFANDPLTDYRCPAQDRFPYQVKLGGTTPKASIWQKTTPTSDGAHVNGGGFVAGTARVDASVYVGPQARVLDHARVFGSARIEGSAVVSGYAIIESGAIVRDQARVTDFTHIRGNAIIEGSARVMEHAWINNGIRISEYAVCKGNSYISGPVHGTGIIDGNYIKSNDVDKGYWFVWSWGSGQHVGELDQEFNQLYLEYKFENPHAYRVWDTYGATWGHLVNGPAYVNDNGGSALSLDGIDDFVDLHQSVALKDAFTIEIDVKWSGGSNSQRLLNFSNSATGNAAWLSPSDSQGKLAFSITIGGATQVVRAANPLPSGAWHKVQVMGFADTVKLLVDGSEWASNSAFSHDLEDVQANECYIGRGPAGNAFAGRIDNFVVWSKALVETQPPTPNPAGFVILPTQLDGNTVMMQAIPGIDGNLPIEYYFEETTGHAGGSDSGWQTSPLFYDRSLVPNTLYTYVVRMRDALGNTTTNSAPANITTPTVHPPNFTQATDGTISMEAENHDLKVTGTLYNNNWVFVNDIVGYSGTGGMRVADAGRQISSQYAPTASPRLDFNVKFDRAGAHTLFVRGHGANYNADSCHAGLDMQELPELQYIGSFIQNGYDWHNSQTFHVPFPGVHKINIWMREDDATIDKVVITPGSTLPTDTGPAESPRGGGDPVISPFPTGTYWSGGGGDVLWSNPANWNDAPPATGDILPFLTTGSGGAVLNNNIAGGSFASMQFESDAPAFTLNGNSVTLTGDPGGNVVLNNSTNTQTINLPITLTGAANLNAATGTIVIGSACTIANAGFDLTVKGAQPVTLNGAFSGSGGVIRSTDPGKLNINGVTALGTGRFTISGGTIDNTSAGAVTLSTVTPQTWAGDFTFAGTRDLNLGTGAVTMNTNTQVTVSAKTLTVGGPITGAVTLTKTGSTTGTLVVSSVGSSFGGLTVSQGTLRLDNSVAAAPTMTVTGTTLSNDASVLDINNATLTTAGINIQRGQVVVRGTSVINNTGGVRITGSADSCSHAYYFNDSATINGGTGNLETHWTQAAQSFYILMQNSAQATFANVIFGPNAEYADSTGHNTVLEVRDTAQLTTPGNMYVMQRINDQNRSNAGGARVHVQVYQHGGTVTAGGNLRLCDNDPVKGAATIRHEVDGAYNLWSGSLLKVGGIITGGATRTGVGQSYFNFHGGTLTYTGAGPQTDWINLTASAVTDGIDSTQNLRIWEGATINTGAQNVTVAQALLAPTGSGVSAIDTTGLTGTMYNNGCPPWVFITRDTASGDTTGSGASAVATINSSGNITGFVITNPGNNYTVKPLITLIRGDLGTPGTVPAANITMATNSAYTGGLTKKGAGKLTLTGTNTYTGPTAVDVGTLALSGSNGSIQNTSRISIAAGATFDVSAKTSPYILSTSTALSASGAASPATLKGATSGTINLGAQPLVLTWGGASSGTDSTHPSLTVSQAALVLANKTFTVVTGTPLNAGVYTLVSAPAGISGTVNATPSYTGGSGVAGGVTGVISISSDNKSVILTVTANLTPFEAWIGNPAFGLATGDRGADKDPDKDGQNNLLEFATNDHPSNGTASGKVRSRIETLGSEQAMVLTLPVRGTAPAPVFIGAPPTATVDGVVYTIGGSNNLATFDQVVTEVTPASAAGMPALDPGWSYRTFRLSGPVPARGVRGFLRVKVEPYP
jgi:autotransporter-associated beta strand protein